jgi:hypothetical protein
VVPLDEADQDVLAALEVEVDVVEDTARERVNA